MFERKQYLISKKFWQYLLPTILMAMSNSLAIVIDGMIVGNLLGARELAAVNLATPLSLMFSTIFAMIGVGGSNLMSFAKGSRNVERSNQIFSISVLLLFLGSIIFPVIGFFFVRQATSALSGQESLNVLVQSYIRVLLFGAPLIVLVSGFTFFIRSDGFPAYASKVLIISNVVNLTMDIVYIKVFGFGIAGAAYATLTGYSVGALLVLFFMLKINNQLHFAKIPANIFREIYSILSTGITSALGQIFIFIKIISINHIVLNTLGTVGMVAFSVCISCLSLVSLFIAGATQTMMPIVGVMLGEKDWRGIKFAVMPAFRFVLYSASLLIVVFLFFPKQILALYGVYEQEFLKTGTEALRFFAPSLLGVAFSFVMMYYNQVVNRKLLAISISVIQGLSVIPIAFFLAKVFGGKGIWLSFSLAEILSAILIFSVSIYIRKAHKGKYETVFLFNKNRHHKELDLTIDGNSDAAVNVSKEITDFASNLGVSNKTSMFVGLAAEEMTMHIINNNNIGNSHIDIVAKIDSEEIILRFRDDGIALNPLACNDDLNTNIYLLKKIAKQLDYVRVIGLNSTIVTLSRE